MADVTCGSSEFQPARDRRGDITRLVSARASERAAQSPVWLEIFEALRRIARRQLRHGDGGGLLDPTALVGEAFLKLFSTDQRIYKDRRHFYAVAARAMKQVLVDAWRRGHAAKGVDAVEWTMLCEAVQGLRSEGIELALLDRWLTELAERDPEAAEAFETHFFFGLDAGEIAELRACSRRTIERDLRFARAWLEARLR